MTSFLKQSIFCFCQSLNCSILKLPFYDHIQGEIDRMIKIQTHTYLDKICSQINGQIDKQIDRHNAYVHSARRISNFIYQHFKIFQYVQPTDYLWDAVAIFNQTIWVCKLSIIAISILTHNIRITDFFSFYKDDWES